MRQRKRKTLLQILIVSFALFLCILLALKYLSDDSNYTNFTNLFEQTELFQTFVLNLNEEKDWHDEEAYRKALSRTGLGELGRPTNLELDPERQRQLFSQNGYNALLSDLISMNRSVPDIRKNGCMHKKYLSNLPQVSIVIPFYDEHWSSLLRSCFSTLNRTPPELLKEIILVDDHSTKEFLGKKLEQYVKQFVAKTRIVRLPERSGLILARLAGARVATADILVFLDSHVEPNYNWLPPLIDPIARDPKTCVCPFIDVIDEDTFEYRAQDEGARGAFDWEFHYNRLPLLPDDLLDETKPFRSPVMAGGLFAINRKFFWDLGGYDEGLDIWGGEQYELSFKIWMCGGRMFDAPCSRVGHIYRGPGGTLSNPRTNDFVHKNFKRVAEVWMDEYKEYLYLRDPDVYANIDAGNLTERRAIRKRLKCKSFKWFMEEIAFDLTDRHPLIDPPDYANGTIRSLHAPGLCLDTLNHALMQEVGIYPCAEDLQQPQENQYWKLSWRRDIHIRNRQQCLDVPNRDPNATVLLYACHYQEGNQYWEYDMMNQWLRHSPLSDQCLEIDETNKKVFMNPCDPDNKRMRWSFGTVNRTALMLMEANREI